MKGKNQQIWHEKWDIRYTQTRQQFVEQIVHGSNLEAVIMSFIHFSYVYNMIITDLLDSIMRLIMFPTRPRMERTDDRIPQIIHLQKISSLFIHFIVMTCCFSFLSVTFRWCILIASLSFDVRAKSNEERLLTELIRVYTQISDWTVIYITTC